MMQINDIFPTPIGITANENYSKDDHKKLLDAEYHTHGIYNMIVTKDKYIYNTAPASIKDFIRLSLDEYSAKTLGTYQKLKITQSWCTKHENIPQETFVHTHQNSIISGVYYVSADETNEGLTFYKDTSYNDNFISWETSDDLKSQHPWNWDWFKFPAKTGMLILFPSRLKHGVIGNVVSRNIRCSLAFNTWFDGSIGTVENFTRLG